MEGDVEIGVKEVKNAQRGRTNREILRSYFFIERFILVEFYEERGIRDKKI